VAAQQRGDGAILSAGAFSFFSSDRDARRSIDVTILFGKLSNKSNYRLKG
jgi:hypothetical protein